MNHRTRRVARTGLLTTMTVAATVLATGLGIPPSHADTTVPLPAVSPSSVVLLTSGSTVPDSVPAVPVGLDDVVALSTAPASAAGVYGANLALRADGTVVGWGVDLDGALTAPAGLTDAVGVDLGLGFALALRADGSVTGWGSDAAGQLDVPADLGPVTAVAALGDAACGFGVALRADGTVAQWGGHDFGACDRPMSWGLPDGLDHVVALSAGSTSAIALRADGTVVVWGPGSLTGDGPAPSTWTDVTAVSTQSGTFVGIRTDQSAYTYGIWGESGAIQPTGVTAGSAGQTAAFVTTTDDALLYNGSSTTRPGPFQLVEGGLYYALGLSTPTTTPPEPEAVLGSTDVQPGLDVLAQGTARAFAGRTSDAATATTAHVYLDATSTADALGVAVYADYRGEPGRLLGSAAVTSPKPGWNAVPLPAPIALRATTRYWLAVRSVSGTTVIRDLPAGSGSASRTTTQRFGITALGVPRIWVSSARSRTAPASLYLD